MQYRHQRQKVRPYFSGYGAIDLGSYWSYFGFWAISVSEQPTLGRDPTSQTIEPTVSRQAEDTPAKDDSDPSAKTICQIEAQPTYNGMVRFVDQVVDTLWDELLKALKDLEDTSKSIGNPSSLVIQPRMAKTPSCISYAR